jgi:hypothetical protein
MENTFCVVIGTTNKVLCASGIDRTQLWQGRIMVCNVITSKVSAQAALCHQRTN